MLAQIRRNSLELIAIMSSIIIVGLATGFTIPLVSLKLAAIGSSMGVIGVMAAAPALGILLAAPLAGTLSLHFSIKKLLLLGIITSAISIIMLFIFKPNVYSWGILRLTMGVAIGILIILGEAYINHIVEDSVRGRIVALYTSSYTACQVAGPSLLAYLGSDGLIPITIITLFHIVAFIFLSAGHCNFPVKRQAGQERNKMSMINFIRCAPIIAVAVFLFAFFDNTVLSIIPLYGLDYHFSERDSVLMISAIFAGDAFLQIPIGWLADHFDRKKIHSLCGLITLIFVIALPFLMSYPFLLWPALMILGGAAGGIYTLGLIRVGEYYTGHRLIMANAYVTFLFGLGSLLGPLMCSTTIALVGSNGLIFTLILIVVIFLLTSIYRPILLELAVHE